MDATHEPLGYELNRVYPVSREILFNALTDATVLKRIWGVQQITVDARVGGKSEAVYIEGEQDWSFTITYVELVPHRALRWITHFHRFPAKETRVSVLLEEASPGTELKIRMENFETAEERDDNRQAWQRGLATLAEIVGQSAKARSTRAEA
jgi:uncharacterized protein YndB with AHSA1/START domain